MAACEFQEVQGKDFRHWEGVGDRVKKRYGKGHMAMKVEGMRKTWAAYCVYC